MPKREKPASLKVNFMHQRRGVKAVSLLDRIFVPGDFRLTTGGILSII